MPTLRPIQKVSGSLILVCISAYVACLLYSIDSGPTSPLPTPRHPKISRNLSRPYDLDKAIHRWSLDRNPREIPSIRGLSHITPCSARRADLLPASGQIVAEVNLAERSDRCCEQLLKDVMVNGVVDANLHVEATICLIAQTELGALYWALLVSEDPYWTNEKHVEIYDFAVSVDGSGCVRLHPASAFPASNASE